MTIIAVTTAAPVRPTALTDGVADIAAAALSLSSEVQDLAKLGIRAQVIIEGAQVLVDLVVRKEAAHLLPALVREMENSGLTRTDTGFRVAGTMYQGALALRLIVDRSQITVAQIETLLPLIDFDYGFEFDAYPAADDEYMGQAA